MTTKNKKSAEETTIEVARKLDTTIAPNLNKTLMDNYSFSNTQIDQACQQVEKALVAYGVERREALRIKLTFEEVLLEYQEKLGEKASFCVRCSSRFSTIRVEVIVSGESFDPMDKAEEDAIVMRELLARLGLAPAWSYKNGKNYIVLLSKKKPLSGTVKMVGAIVLAVIAGIILNLLPDGIRIGANDYLLTPVTNAFIGLLSAVSGPLIFLSVLGSICSMGNMETLGKIGGKAIKVILLYMTVIGAFMTAFGSLFYNVEKGNGSTSNFSQILDLIYDIIPSNLFEPFITGNALQLIFIAVIVGIAMLVLSSRVNGVFTLVEQLSFIVQTMMSGLCSMLPILIFFIFAGMISNGNFGIILCSWKIIVVIVLMIVVYHVANLLRISLAKKISPALLFKKAWPTLFVALTTASSAAAFETNTRDANSKLGIDKKLVEFGIPVGQVLFKPGFFALFFGLVIGLAESYNIPITLPWIVISFATILLVNFAVPPIPGGAMMGFATIFAQLGIPMEAMGIAIAINAIADFPATAGSVSGWQLTLIDVADSLNMIDRKVLHSEETNTNGIEH